MQSIVHPTLVLDDEELRILCDGVEGMGRRGGGGAPERRALCKEGICRGSEQEERRQDGNGAVHFGNWTYGHRCQRQRERELLVLRTKGRFRSMR